MLFLYMDTFTRVLYFIMGITTGYMLHIYRNDIHEMRFISHIIDKLRGPIMSNWLCTASLLSTIYLPSMILHRLTCEQDNMLIFDTNIFYIGFAWTYHILFYVLPIIFIQLSTCSLSGYESSPFRRFLAGQFYRALVYP